MLRSFFPVPVFEAPNDGGGAKPWFDGKVTDAETIGYLTARGWDKDVTVAALEATKAHREAEKKLGAPAAELVRLPKDANDPKWSDVYQRLGMPKEAGEYDLSNVKDVGDKPLDAAVVDALRKTAHALNLPKDKAPILAQAIVKMVAEKGAASDADKAAKIVEEKGALTKNWGANMEANMFIARQTAAKLGMTPEEVNALENAAGYAKTMEMLRQIGIRIGEDKFVRDDRKPGNGLMTKEEAKSAIADLKADRDWVKRYSAGGAAEKKQLEALQKLELGIS